MKPKPAACNRFSRFLWNPGLAAAASVALFPGFRCHLSCGRGKVTAVHLVAYLNPKTQKPGPRRNVFSPLEPKFVAAVTHRDLEPETEIRVIWRYLGPGKSLSTTSPVKPGLFWQSVKVLEGSGVTFYGVPRRGGPWPPGRYRVTVQMNGRTVRNTGFTVTAAPQVRLTVSTTDTETPPWKKGSDKPSTPRFQAGKNPVYVLVTALNPKPGASLRVTWERLAPENGEKGKPKFYAETEPVRLTESTRLAFPMPMPAGADGHCPGRYRASVAVEEKRLTAKDFVINKSPPPPRRTN